MRTGFLEICSIKFCFWWPVFLLTWLWAMHGEVFLAEIIFVKKNPVTKFNALSTLLTACLWVPMGSLVHRSFFSVQCLHGFRQVVQYALWHCRIINFQINARGRLLIEDHKRELVRDLYIVQKAVIPRKAQINKTKNNKKQQTDNKSNHKPKQPK